MPCHFTNPTPTSGAAAAMHAHDVGSRPSDGSSARKTPTAAAHASAAKAHCRSDSPKNTPSV